MAVSSLRLKSVGLFGDASFKFDPNVNVFTGPNNTGKSTVLVSLAEIMVYPFTFPMKLLRGGKHAHFQIAMKGRPPVRGRLPIDIEDGNANEKSPYVRFLKLVGYTSFVPALRTSTDFRSKGPGKQSSKRTNIGHMVAEDGRWLRVQDMEGETPSEDPPTWSKELHKRNRLIGASSSLLTDSGVIQAIIDLDYRSYREHTPEMRSLVTTISEIASDITEGFEITFSGVGEDKAGLFPRFRTPDGEMPLNYLSQGTQSLIQWLAYFIFNYAQYYDYPPDLRKYPSTLIVDEIDAHFHPTWQRRVIPTLLRHFPRLQLFCSTHSPLMLAGLKSGQIHLLNRKSGKIEITRNTQDIGGWTVDEILRCFLDIKVPSDIETSRRLKRLDELRQAGSLSEAETAELKVLREQVACDVVSGPGDQMQYFKEILGRAVGGLAPNQRKRTMPKLT